MLSSSEYRQRARAALGGRIFGSLWLMALLAGAIVGAVLSLAGATVIGTILVYGPLYVGYAAIMLKLARGRGEVDIADSAKGFLEGYVDNLLLGLIAMVKIFLWSLLFVIPGIIKAYSYSMIYYVKNDHPSFTWRECLAESERLMKGKRMNLFLLDLSFLGWILLMPFTFGIGILWLSPYMEQSHAQFYESIR
jgi:uncharacterized membrane protein